LLRNCKFDRCLVNKDVLAALTMPNVAQPFVAHTIPGTIQAADYDLGRNGTAYFDDYAARTDFAKHDPHNQGGAYRNDGVDVLAVADAASKGYAVGHTTTGEWLNYTVTVPKAGTFALQARLTNPTKAAAKLAVRLDNHKVVATVTVEPGAAWQTVAAGTVALPAGKSTVQLYVEQPGATISWLRFAAPNAPLQGGQ
jgi:hypothetical protein